jgi:hypothetical protein
MENAKTHVPIPHELASEVLFASDRTCCVCQIPGRRVQIHHIDEDPSDNSFENLAVLCFMCHDETQVSGGFARRLDAAVVARFRHDWLDRVRARRAEADRLVVASKTATVATTPAKPVPAGYSPPDLPPRTGLMAYVNTLPELRRLAYEAARPGWDSGVTLEMVEASRSVIDAFVLALVQLARYYPAGHFDREDPRDYFSELIATRFRWHSYRYSTAGKGYSGTIVGPLATAAVMADVEQMIEDTVSSLLFAELSEADDNEFRIWQEKWKRSASRGNEGV